MLCNYFPTTSTVKETQNSRNNLEKTQNARSRAKLLTLTEREATPCPGSGGEYYRRKKRTILKIKRTLRNQQHNSNSEASHRTLGGSLKKSSRKHRENLLREDKKGKGPWGPSTSHLGPWRLREPTSHWSKTLRGASQDSSTQHRNAEDPEPSSKESAAAYCSVAESSLTL